MNNSELKEFSEMLEHVAYCANVVKQFNQVLFETGYVTKSDEKIWDDYTAKLKKIQLSLFENHP